jgi:hypothetical protein
VVASPDAASDRSDCLGGSRDPVLQVTMAGVANEVAISSWRESRTTGSTGPGQKSPRWSVERRASLRRVRASAQIGIVSICVTSRSARRSWRAVTGATHAPGRLRRSAISSSGWHYEKKQEANRKEERNERDQTIRRGSRSPHERSDMRGPALRIPDFASLIRATSRAV